MPTYNYTTLDAPSATSSTQTSGINDLGQIVGNYVDNSGNHGFFYNRGTYTTLDGPATATFRNASAINDAGQIVGNYTDGSGYHSYIYSGGTYTTLANPATSTYNFATSINDAGQIVGAYFDGNVYHGYLYSGGTYTTLDDPLAATYLDSGTIAQSVNAADQIVGYYNDASGHNHGFLYSGGTYTTLDDPSATGGTQAEGINDAGQIVGTYVDGSGSHGFLYSGGTYTTLDDSSATSNTTASGINDAGQIVGSYSTGAHGFLATLPPTSTVATNINTSIANAFTLAAQGDLLYVPFQTSVLATGAGFSGVLFAGVGGVVENHGAIFGNQYGIILGTAGATSSVVVGSDGAVSGFIKAAISITANGAGGGFTLDNSGQVTGLAGATGIIVKGGGQINNTGTISGSTGIAQTDTTAGDAFLLYNTDTGTIVGGYNGSTSTINERISNHGFIRGNVTLGSGNGDFMANGNSITFGTVTFGNGNNDLFQNYAGMGGLIMGNGNGDVVQNFGNFDGNVTLGNGTGDYFGNAGRIDGAVILGNGAGQTFDSTAGTIFSSTNLNGISSITAGSGGDTIVGAVNGGAVNGGAGNDVLIANQTQDAAYVYNATTSLDGHGGVNALYGDGAHTTFIAGDTNGGYNQIWGGISQTTSVFGYANNTLSFATASAGVFVDLLNGHDAYVGSTPGGAWTGTGTYEDSISNVPNVVGSAFGDVIQDENRNILSLTGDRVTGGGGADALYAGSGANSQDTFIYTAYGDSNTVTGYDTIVGFKLGTDKIDLSALNTSGAHLAISTAGTSNTLYVEQTPGTFNAATDLAMIVNTSTAGGLHASDFVF